MKGVGADRALPPRLDGPELMMATQTGEGEVKDQASKARLEVILPAGFMYVL